MWLVNESLAIKGNPDEDRSGVGDEDCSTDNDYNGSNAVGDIYAARPDLIDSQGSLNRPLVVSANGRSNGGGSVGVAGDREFSFTANAKLIDINPKIFVRT
ncbi:Hypothetical predicted protein [Octopus vulgaris]|uniref:Uncharacterized protein n=1 Tax=Octopus vulgaris TaxID=6645 RepID=A0AA36F0A9_OCTVU|nr:Hypothetical predicted protein [Octopus vulgaris]